MNDKDVVWLIYRCYSTSPSRWRLQRGYGTEADGWLAAPQPILWNSMTSTFFVFTELANAMKYGGGFLYNLVFTEWRHFVSQNEVWGRGYYITLFSPSDVTAFHRIPTGVINAPCDTNIFAGECLGGVFLCRWTLWDESTAIPGEQKTLDPRWLNVASSSATLAQY